MMSWHAAVVQQVSCLCRDSADAVQKLKQVLEATAEAAQHPDSCLQWRLGDAGR